MAKRGPGLTLWEIEQRLGYQADSLHYPDDAEERFYTDLSPVTPSRYDRARKELEERERRRPSANQVASVGNLSDQEVPHVQSHQRSSSFQLTHWQVVEHGAHVVTYTRWESPGLYNFAVKVRFKCGLVWPMLWTQREVMMALTARQVMKGPLK